MGGRGSPCPAPLPPGKWPRRAGTHPRTGLQGGHFSAMGRLCFWTWNSAPAFYTPEASSNPPVRQLKCLQTLPSVPWGWGTETPRARADGEAGAQTAGRTSGTDQSHNTAYLAFSPPGLWEQVSSSGTQRVYSTGSTCRWGVERWTVQAWRTRTCAAYQGQPAFPWAQVRGEGLPGCG